MPPGSFSTDISEFGLGQSILDTGAFVIFMFSVLFTQYMIINFAFLNTCFEAHTRHMHEATRYTSQLTAVQDAVVLELNTRTTSRNEPSHMKIERPGINLWSRTLIHNHPTTDGITCARLNHQLFSKLPPLHCIVSDLDSQSDSKSTAVFGGTTTYH